MASYQIVRIECESCPASSVAQHVVAVATGDWTLYNRIWRADEVLQGIDGGESFYTQSASGSQRFPVACIRCAKCGQAHVILQRFDGPSVIFRPHW